jgi:hypothetical protein
MRAHLPRPAVEDRLVVQFKFVHEDGGAQLALDKAAVALVAEHVRIERHDAAAPGLLALVERQVGNGDQLVGVVAVERRQGNADRG